MRALTTVPVTDSVRRSWNVAAIAAMSLYVLSLVVFCVAVVSPELVRDIGLGMYANNRAFWPIFIQVALALTAFGCYYWPRRRENRSFTVLVSGVLAATTMAVGLTSYLNCQEAAGQSVFWAPLTWSINLVGGNVSSCTPATGGGIPLTLQLARLSGPLLLVIAALGIAAAVFRTQYDRIVVRYARSLVVLVGLDDPSLPLLRRLASERDRGVTLAVLVTDPAGPLVKIARDLGARVVAVQPTDLNVLSSLFTSRGRFKIRAFYAASDKTAANLRWAERLRLIADASKRSRADLPPRMIVRIDDPWQAEYWRRTNSYRTEGNNQSVQWMSDALSVYEVTASLLLDRILLPPAEYDRLVIVGHSPLALALCAELAQRERESAELEQPMRLGFADVLLLGPQAELLRDQHRLRQARFGNDEDRPPISVNSSEATSGSLGSALAGNRKPVVILADDPAVIGAGQATFLAASNPNWTFYDWSPRIRGVPDRPIMERLYLFGLTTEAPRSVPVDSWERAARIVHERFLLDMVRTGRHDPSKPSHQPWDRGLDPFYQQSNIRQVTTALATAEDLGRSWGPIQPGSTGQGLVATTDFSEADLDFMARTEHASWTRFLRDRGWRHGVDRDDARRIHPALVDWKDLTPDDQRKTRDGVVSALKVLAGLGYRSTALRPDAKPELAWTAVTRRGEVTAVRMDADWTWVGDNGDTMQAHAGDWKVTNDEGRSWSVAPGVFAHTYAPIGGDRWRRTGQAHARPATPGEVVTSLEGEQTARPGDWVVRGAQGEMWLTGTDHFRENYAVLDPAAGPSRPAGPSESDGAAQPKADAIANAGP